MKKILLTFSCLLIMTTAVLAQWSSNPLKNNRVSIIENEVWNPEFQIGPENTVYIVYQTPLYDEEEVCLHFQIMDIKGKMLFPEEGKIVTKKRSKSFIMVNKGLLVDKDGNALLAISDCRNSPIESKNLSYTLYKLSPKGEVLWSEEGIDLEDGESYDFEAFFNMIQLENGNYIVSWFSYSGITVQCISPSGDILWKKTEGGAFPYLCKAGDNEYILVYNGNGISARKFNENGEEIWKTNVYNGQLPCDVSNVPFNTIVRVFPDLENGGVFVSWYDFRNDPDLPSPYVSYIKPDGSYGFVSGNLGERLGYTLGMGGYRPSLYYDKKNNSLFACWLEKNKSQSKSRLMIQKLAMTGELKWGESGIIASPYTSAAVDYASIKNAPDGQIAVFYMTSYAWSDVKAYMLLANQSDGKITNNSDELQRGFCFSTLACTKGDLEVSPLTDNWYWLAMWKDGRTVDDIKVESRAYMQRINIDSSLGYKENPDPNSIVFNDINPNSSLTILPSTFNKEITIFFDNPVKGKVIIDIYSISGQKIATVCDETMDEGLNSILWNYASLSSGSYLITCTTKDKYQSVRAVLK